MFSEFYENFMKIFKQYISADISELEYHPDWKFTCMPAMY